MRPAIHHGDDAESAWAANPSSFGEESARIRHMLQNLEEAHGIEAAVLER
jgi:hypothetical protein